MIEIVTENEMTVHFCSNPIPLLRHHWMSYLTKNDQTKWHKFEHFFFVLLLAFWWQWCLRKVLHDEIDHLFSWLFLPERAVVADSLLSFYNHHQHHDQLEEREVMLVFESERSDKSINTLSTYLAQFLGHLSMKWSWNMNCHFRLFLMSRMQIVTSWSGRSTLFSVLAMTFASTEAVGVCCYVDVKMKTMPHLRSD